MKAEVKYVGTGEIIGWPSAERRKFSCMEGKQRLIFY